MKTKKGMKMAKSIKVKKPRKKRMKSWEIFQRHHLEYGPEPAERVVRITRTEHFFAGRMENYAKARGLTPGFCEALLYYIQKYKKEDV
jgi:hypothetical protein